MPEVKFKIDPNKELEYLAEYEAAASSFNTMPEEWRTKIWNSGVSQHRSEIIKLIDKRWSEVGSGNKKRTENFKIREQIWRKYEKKYFGFIEDITKIKWQHPNYICYGAVYSYPNFYKMDWARPEIIVCADDMDVPQVKIAHELFHAHQVTIFNKLIGKNYLEKVSYDFIESMLIIVFTDKTSPFDLDRAELVEERKEYLDQDLHSSFDQLVKEWDTRKSFEDFVRKSAVDA